LPGCGATCGTRSAREAGTAAKEHAAQHYAFRAFGIGRLAGITARQDGGEKLDANRNADQHVAEAQIMADIKRHDRQRQPDREQPLRMAVRSGEIGIVAPELRGCAFIYLGSFFDLASF
jgi:hypothetical protein